jgi:hypothetical protein
MRNERESKGGLPLGVQRVTLGDSVNLTDCDPACIIRTASPLKMGPICCPETSANYQRTLRVIRQKNSLRCNGSPKDLSHVQYTARYQIPLVTTQLHKTAVAIYVQANKHIQSIWQQWSSGIKCERPLVSRYNRIAGLTAVRSISLSVSLLVGYPTETPWDEATPAQVFFIRIHNI